MGDYGFKKLITWQNTARIRKRVYDITAEFPRAEMRRVSQMRDAARSGKQNIQEGYMRDSIGDDIRSLRISKGSLGELAGDVDDCHEDDLITREVHDEVSSLIAKTDYLLKRQIESLENRRKMDSKKGRK